MRVRRRVVDGTLHVAVSGVLRATPRSIQFFNEISASIVPGIKGLTLDLGNVLFADSLWLGFLVTLTLKCKDTGIPFTLLAVSRQLWGAVTGSHIDRVLPTPGLIEGARHPRAARAASVASSANGR